MVLRTLGLSQSNQPQHVEKTKDDSTVAQSSECIQSAIISSSQHYTLDNLQLTFLPWLSYMYPL